MPRNTRCRWKPALLEERGEGGSDAVAVFDIIPTEVAVFKGERGEIGVCSDGDLGGGVVRFGNQDADRFILVAEGEGRGCDE